MTMIKVVAAAGRRVRDPATGRVIPAAGIEVDDTVPYWRKRLNQKDVVKAPAETPPAEPASPPPPPAAAAPASPPPASPPPAPPPAPVSPPVPAAPPAAKPTQPVPPAE
jgi:hypothetical protein